jgi:hypothetical protein
MAQFPKKGSVVIDKETLGKWDDAVILSIGLTYLSDVDCALPNLSYTDMLQRSVEFKLDVRSQVALGRTVDKSTMEWWQRQGESASKVLKASPEDIPVHNIFPAIEAWLKSKGVTWKEVRWFDRNAFDMKKLQHLHEVTLNLGNQPPWDYQEVWGIETMLKFMSQHQNRYGAINPYHFKDPAFVYHSAACDAALDMYRYYLLFQEGEA